MVKKSGSTNPEVIVLIRYLKKLSREQDAAIWKRIADMLERPSRKQKAVNLSRINRYGKNTETVIIPGKVLGTGKLTNPFVIAAMGFSATAREKIVEKGGKCISILELTEQNPKGSNIRIIQ
ncbi:MAG: 50S ribosomal protein L18e [Candidatus Hodarchaeota archaeon]